MDNRPEFKTCPQCLYLLPRDDFTRSVDHQRKAIYSKRSCKLCDRPRSTRNRHKWSGHNYRQVVPTTSVYRALRMLLDHYGTKRLVTRNCGISHRTLLNILERDAIEVNRQVAEKVIRHALEVKGLAPSPNR